MDEEVDTTGGLGGRAEQESGEEGEEKEGVMEINRGRLLV